MIYLSIVIPVRNEERFIVDTLKALINQNYPHNRYELIIVDGMSTDSTLNLVRSFIKKNSEINIRLLENPRFLSSCARNIGVRVAKGQLIGVIDGHVYIPDNKLFFYMEKYATINNALCLSRPAPLDVPGLTKGKPYWIAVARKSWLGHSRGSFIYSDHEGFVDPISSGFAYNKKVFETVGYFDESFDAAEDVEFHHRLKKAGIMAYTSPKLLIYSYPRSTFFSLFKQQIRYGEGRANFIRKHPDAFTKETVIPSGIFIMLLFYPITYKLIVNFPFIHLLYSFLIFLYFLLLLGTGIFESFRKGNIYQGLTISIGILTTHLGLGYGFIKQYLSFHKLLR